jgi:hypothetical protein
MSLEQELCILSIFFRVRYRLQAPLIGRPGTFHLQLAEHCISISLQHAGVVEHGA